MLSIRMPLSSGAYFYLFSIWSWIPVQALEGIVIQPFRLGYLK